KKQLLIGPLKVEQERDGFTHPAVLKHGATQVEGEPLHAHRIVVGDRLLDDAAFPQCWAVVSGGPVLGGVLKVVIELAGLEGLQCYRHVAVIVEIDRVEIILATADWQVRSPPVLDPCIAYRAPGGKVDNLVRATAQWWLEAGAAEVAL